MSNALKFTGQLGENDFPDLLQLIATGQRTGTLVVERTDPKPVEKRIVFRRGQILSTASTDPKEYLGHFLVSHGYLDEETLARAIQMQDTNRMLLGRILVDLGAIGESDLEDMLRLKAHETVFDLFTWTGAEFEFKPDELPSFALVPLALDVDMMLLHGAQRADESQRVRELIPSYQCVPVSVGRIPKPPDDPKAARILSLVNDDRTVEEIALEAHTSEFAVGKVLSEQVLGGRLKIVRPRFVERAAPAAPRSSKPGPGMPVAAKSTGPDGLLDNARTLLRQGELARSYTAMREALRDNPDLPELRRASGVFSDQLRNALTKDGLDPSAVPHLAVALDDISTNGLSAEEGFLISRIDGGYDISAILKITPMEPLAALVAIWRLVREGTVELK